MTTEAITEYLRIAKDLESSIYTQEKAIQMANKKLVMPKPALVDIDAIKRQVAKKTGKTNTAKTNNI